MKRNKMNAIANYMDDEIRESVHNDLAPCADFDFIVEYVDRDPDFLVTLKQEFKSCFTDDEKAELGI